MTTMGNEPHAPFTLQDAVIVMIYEYKRRLHVVAVLDEGDEWGFEKVLTLRLSALRSLLKECSERGYRVAKWQNMKPEMKAPKGILLPPIFSAHRDMSDQEALQIGGQVHNWIMKDKHYERWQP